MFRPKLYLLSVALLLVALMAGCGGNGGGGSLDTSASTPQALTADEMNPAAAAFLVSSTIPANGAINVATYKVISATFNVPMNSSTINGTTFILKQGTKIAPVPGTVTYANQTATFNPTGNLADQFVYTATLTTGIRNMAGGARPMAFSWRFTTGLRPVPLRSAARFAVLASSTVTNTDLKTIVNGSLGLSPGTAVAGFPPGEVHNGAIYAGVPVAAQAQLDLTKAYNNAAARSRARLAVAGNLGGMTLYPGLYKSGSSLAVSSGDLTLDAKGNPDAVFIFQVASTFTMTSGRQIILSGGAQADNIYWQVGSSATLGTTSVFKGNILAMASVSVETNATVEGRLLAMNGAVTLDGNTITRP